MGKMPAGLRRYWAKKRAAKRARRVSRPTAHRRRSYSMARRSGRRCRVRRKTLFRTMKGALYVGAIAIPAYNAYKQTAGGAEGAAQTAKAMCFIGVDNKFSWEAGKQMWLPVGGLLVLDVATSKLGLQKRVARAISSVGM